VATPDFSQRVDSRIAAAVDRGKLLNQVWIVAELFFEFSHFVWSKCFVQVAFQVGLSEVGSHSLAFLWTRRKPPTTR
jgi:hypothetical protein